MLAPVQPLSIRAGTLTNGHTVLLLRALVAGVPSQTPGISSDGRLSMAHIEDFFREEAIEKTQT